MVRFEGTCLWGWCHSAYLAYELKKKNEDVTILARGERYKELKENGLIISIISKKEKQLLI